MAVFNFLLYLFLWICLYTNRRQEKSALFITSLWVFASFLGIFYYQSDEYRKGGHEITLFPFIYMFICFAIFLIPFIKQKHRIEKITCKNDEFLLFISIVIVVLSVIPFFELIFCLYKLIISGEFFLLGAGYEAIATGNADSTVEISQIGNLLQSYSRSFKTITPILIFYYLQNNKINYFIVIGLFCSSIIPSLYNLTIGNRTELIWAGLYYSFLYVVLHQIINVRYIGKVKSILFFLVIVSLFSFSAISIGRFVLSDNSTGHYGDVWAPILKYASESMFNFNAFAYHEENLMYGHVTANPLFDFINNTNTSLIDTRNYLDSHMKSPSWIFYSFIGDFYLDYGLFGSIIFIAIVSSFFTNYRFKSRMPIEKLIIYSIYIYMVVNGLFYFCYITSWNPIKYIIVITILMSVYKNCKRNKKTSKLICK